MKGRIVIELDDTGGDFGITVDVSGDLDTMQAIGLLEIAKAQHLASKHTQGPPAYAEQTPTGWRDMLGSFRTDPFHN